MKHLAKSSTALVLMLTLTACSQKPVGSETSQAIFEVLGKTLPTASRSDTDQTKLEVATHRKVFIGLCVELGHCQPMNI